MNPLQTICILLLFAYAPAPNAEQLSRQALELLQNGKAEQAIATLKEAVAQDPNFFPAYSLLGVSYSQLGKPQQARTFFEKAVQLAPNSAQARNNLGANYLALKRPADAAAQFEKAVAADVKNVSAWVNLANSRVQLGQASKALAALERARALAPGDTEVLITTATLLEKNGRAAEARELLRSAGPNSVAGIVAFAGRSSEQGDYKTALFLLTAVEDSQHNSAAWHEMVGYAHFKLEQAEPALKHLQRAIQLDPRNEDYYLTLAEFLGTNNAIDTVVTVFETASKALPESTKIQTSLGLAYLMIGDTAKSEAVLSKVVAKWPAYEIGYKLLADCHQRAQDWEQLKAVSSKLRDLNQTNSAGWYYGAMAEYQLMKTQGRAASLEMITEYTRKAMRLDPNDWRAHVLSGKLLLERKQALKAIGAFREAISLNKQEPSSHYLLATTLRQLGRVEESKAALAGFQKAQAEEKARKFRTLLVDIRQR